MYNELSTPVADNVYVQKGIRKKNPSRKLRMTMTLG